MPSGQEIVVERVIDAPRRAVFEAWVRPERLVHWWGPRGFENVVQEMDVRPGGAWRIVQRSPDGAVHPFRGSYLEVAAPERLVFTQRYDVAPWAEEQLLVTLILADAEDKTRLSLTDRFASQRERDENLGRGVLESLERLAKELAPRASEDGTALEILAVRMLDAPPARVWEMWTEPSHLARWRGPQGFTTTTQEMDVRTGGVWRFVMRGPDGAVYPTCTVRCSIPTASSTSTPSFRALNTR